MLDEVLHVLVIAHKYCATEIEERAQGIISHMDLKRKFSASSRSASSLVEIGATTKNKELMTFGWERTMAHFADMTRSTYSPESVPERRRAVKDLLDLSEKTSSDVYLGEAYYAVMRIGPEEWEFADLLPSQKRRLWKGAFRCSQVFDKTFSNNLYRSRPDLFIIPNDPLRSKVVPKHFDLYRETAWSLCSSIPSYDFLRRFNHVLSMDCPLYLAKEGTILPFSKRLELHRVMLKYVGVRLGEERAGIPKYFHDSESEP